MLDGIQQAIWVTGLFKWTYMDAWNELPQYVVDAETVNSFKARLDKFFHKI